MQFHQFKGKEIQYLCGFLVKICISLFQRTKSKLNNMTVPLLSQTLESDVLWYFLEKNIWIKSLAVEMGKTKNGKTQ